MKVRLTFSSAWVGASAVLYDQCPLVCQFVANFYHHFSAKLHKNWQTEFRETRWRGVSGSKKGTIKLPNMTIFALALMEDLLPGALWASLMFGRH